MFLSTGDRQTRRVSEVSEGRTDGYSATYRKADNLCCLIFLSDYYMALCFFSCEEIFLYFFVVVFCYQDKIDFVAQHAWRCYGRQLLQMMQHFRILPSFFCSIAATHASQAEILSSSLEKKVGVLEKEQRTLKPSQSMMSFNHPTWQFGTPQGRRESE